ncbi:nonribosomal peptide synthetase-like protein 2 [Clohesyomyces aquaticus]|uniref:Nonribosomal peptide synthetase-like protein 2 n=1 Tax=Clohesyomyces aquaticus TaxID=1231657 RepID=A0A1Y1YNR7_9PLEO|nr:nonribosomal peptide synthetase-like protein 2 [Clohesyomyces aquaticus]
MLPEPPAASELSILNPNPATIKGPELLHQLVRKLPNNAELAIDFLEDGSKRRKFSYESLHHQSDELAARIRHKLAVLKDASSIVPVFLAQSPELYITLLAILKAGKAFCPLALDTPEERLRFILDDVSASLVITTSVLREKLTLGERVQVLMVDTVPESTRHTEVLRAQYRPTNTNDLAYVLYTSGSTGLPKAVSVSHRAVTQSLIAHDRHIPSFSRFLQFAAPTFDVSIFEIFFPWFRGRTLVGCSRTRMLDDLPGFINSMEVDAAELTPTVVSNFLHGRESVPGLSLLLTIGEMLTRNVIQEFGGTGSRKSILWGMYGPTEAAIHCTLQPSFQSEDSVGNIGFPLDTVSAFIVEPISKGTPATRITVLPVGEVGELVVGGPQVAEEYLNRPELTSASFIQHPDYGYLYRTGDKARVLPHGALECLGRIVSGQVKFRGQRIELGEIEQIIMKEEGCHTASTMVIEDTLVAFVGSKKVTENDVRNACKRWLPGYMIPSDIVVVPQMPQLASGKMDKMGLQSQYLRGRHTRDSSFRKSASGSGEAVQEALESVLNRKITASMDLVSAGMDSLRSIRAASILRERGYDVGAMDVLSANNLQELLVTCGNERTSQSGGESAHFDSFKDVAMRDSGLRSRQADIADIIPCTPLQEAMLAETINRPNAYCNWIEVELPTSHGFLQIRSLLDVLTKRHDILRSGFRIAASPGLSSFAQIVWKTIATTQVVETTQFSRGYSLGSAESLLRPLTIQVDASTNRTRLLFQIHHALYDGWSFDILLRDLTNIIQQVPLSQCPPFRHVVAYYTQEADGTRQADSRIYWEEVLKGYQPAPLPNFNGKYIPDKVLRSLLRPSAIDLRFLQKRANDFMINPQVFFQAALAYVLGSYLGSTDVVFGTVTSGRTLPIAGIEDIMGPCIASLPLRLDLSQFSTVQSMLNKVQRMNREMLKHSALPLRDIVKACALPPSSRLFDVLFVWQETLFRSDRNLLAGKIVGSADDLEFGLTLEFEPDIDSVSSKVTYDPSRFPKAQIQYLLQQIDEIVIHFLESPDSSFHDISRCFHPENLAVANASPRQTNFSYGPANAVERGAVKHPEKLALVIGALVDGSMVERDKITYAALNSRANQLAFALIERGVRPDSLVCVLLEKSVNLYVSILAILKAGAGYLPILPDSPPERTTRILSDAKVRLCVSERSFSRDFRQDGQYSVLELDNFDTSRYPDRNFNVKYDGSHLAYAVFTSGSTGLPKGVLVTQDNLMSNLEVLHDIYPSAASSRLLQACSQAFDVSVFEIFFAWYAGMCLCSVTKDDLYHDFQKAIASLDITHLSLTPTVASLVDPGSVPTVQFLVTAGEALTEHVRRQWAGKGLYQGYGPSETTNICTVRPSVTAEDSINNIGAPLRNTSAFVLDPASNTIVPRGGIGELCFGGAQVFRAYLNMPELNAKKIINHPSFGRIYRSGDMGILLPDDSILFNGRSDDQVKIRGQRVELGEINAAVLDGAVVEDCVTLLFQGGDSSQKLVTFWVPKESSSRDLELLPLRRYSSAIQEIFESLALRLPNYMLPSHLVPISRIPTTSQSKVDKHHLHSLFQRMSAQDMDFVAFTPTASNEDSDLSEKEKSIAVALAQSIGIPTSDVKRKSSFFSLGLDSISAIKFSRCLGDVGFEAVPISLILKNASVARLAAVIDNFTRLDASPSGHPRHSEQLLQLDTISQVHLDFGKRGQTVQKVLPCTPLQEALLSSTSLTMDSSYCNTMVFDISGEMSRLAKSWSLMFQRHEILRTTFTPTEDPQHAFVQVILEYEDPTWDKLEPSDHLEAYAQRILSQRLELFEPPVKLAMVESGTTLQMLFCCHHALYDGQAISSLIHEVEQTYHGVSLPPAVPYDCYLRHMVSQDLTAADNFWETSLNGFEPTMFPDLTGRVSNGSGKSATAIGRIQMPLTEVLKACQDSSVSLLSVVQAAWLKLLYFYTGETDLCFGTVVSGRSLPEEGLERLVAPCFNTLPVRPRCNFQGTNMDLVRQLHEFNINCAPFHLTPLRRIQTKASKGTGPLFDTLVILQQPNKLPDGSVWKLVRDTGTMDVPIVCEVSQIPLDDSISLSLHYHIDLLSENDAHIVAETFSYALRSYVSYPQAGAGDTIGFPSQILANANHDFVAFELADQVLLHSAFERNAALHPDQTALEFCGPNTKSTIWSFGELNAKANQIAHALIEHGVEPDDIVPVYVAKSLQFYASIIGVLKAGAAFAPIHPDLPDARKGYMLSELCPKVLVHVEGSSLEWCTIVKGLNVDTLGEFSEENPVIRTLRSTNLAYCLYTSGSTGVPKAVCVEHRSPIQTIESSRQRIPWNKDSRLLQYAAITFDMCYYDCFLAWSFGFTLCVAQQDVMFNDIMSVINMLEVNLLDLTPSVAASIIREQVPSVQWLYCIGEALLPEIIQRWDGACVNSYGPTEAAFCTTIFPTREDIKSTVIGKPFPTTSFAVFPKHGERVVPVLGAGELYIGGAQIARGYYNNHALTEDKFVYRNGQRFYKSGDVVRMLGNGDFEFISRADDQVKIRGLRVELGEISQVIQLCDERISTVTTQILKKDSEAKEQLVAFMATTARRNPGQEAELKKKAKQATVDRLPSYMVPQFLIFIDKIPMSMAGKVDKHALTAIFRETGDDKSSPEGVASHSCTATERQVRAIFAKLSETAAKDIDPTTSIYQLGLDSISAVQIASSLRREGHKVNAADILKYVSCAELSKYLDRSQKENPPSALQFNFQAFETKFRSGVLQACRVKSADVEAVRPCTPLQSGMVSKFIMEEGGMYFNSVRLRLEDSIDVPKLRKAWTLAMRQHQMLRTGFVELKDRNHSIAMLHWTPLAVNLPWEQQTNVDHVLEADEWNHQTATRALNELHKPPWQIRCIKMSGRLYLDLAMLHALFDAQSLQTIFNDVLDAYKGRPTTSPPPLEPVLGAIINLSENGDAERIEFWKKFGTGLTPSRFPSMAPLRYDPAPPAVVTLSSSKSLLHLEAGCRKSNITLQAAGIASWASLLSAYTGETSVTFGVVLSGRTFEAAESAVFPCITTVPFMCKVGDDKQGLLAEIMALNSELPNHQFTPLNEIQRSMGFPNTPLFDTLFAFQKIPNKEQSKALWEVVDERAAVDYPISIELEPIGGHLEFRLNFLPHMVPKEQAVLMLDQLDHLISDFVLHETPSESEDQYTQDIYSITPAMESTIPSDARLLHEFVESSAVKYPNRIALEFATAISHNKFDSETWTYAQLEKQGNQIARLLVSRGVRPGDLISICFEKCPEASFAILGILKAGAAFVALDPGAPSARKAFITKDSGATTILSMKAQSRDLGFQVDVPIINLDEADLTSVPATKPILDRDITPQDCSYCLYTSGTTGTPKGCEITHENAVQAMLSFQRLFAGHWTHESRWLQFASFHFDVSVLEQYWSWSVGIQVVSAPRDVIFESLATSIRVLEITHIDLTPSLARILHPDDVPSLCKGVFITGGESLKQEILDVWGPKGVIYNGYGPTEATIGVTMYPRVPANGKPSNIGPQFDNVGSYVLKPNSDVPVLRGAVGELCVSGRLVGKGYLNRPELTLERFPHLSLFDERVYRTGDLVRIMHDGAFEFLGRADDQVKLRGQRLEIGEINSVIKQSDVGISDVATLVLKHPKQQKEQLVAFIVTGSKKKGEPKIVLAGGRVMEKAKEACQDKLPGYMVPTHFVALSSMPLSTNNKAETRKLKEMYDGLSAPDLQHLSGTSTNNSRKWSQAEAKIRDVLKDMLQIDGNNVLKTTSIFELGLDSISVIGFVRALKEAGFSKAKASNVMKNSTVTRLAKVLTDSDAPDSDRGSIIAAQQSITAAQHRHRRAVAELMFVDPRNIKALAPCTPLQQGMIARSLDSNQGLYFNTFKFRLSNSVDESRLESAWKEVFTATQTLRTVFATTEDGFVQAELGKMQFPWKSCDAPNDDSLNGLMQDLRTKWWQQSHSPILKRPFELIFFTSPKQRVLIVHVFHALYDGNSIEMLFKSVWNVYSGNRVGDIGLSFQSVLAYGPLRFVEGARDFWRKQLAGDTLQSNSKPTERHTAKPATTVRKIRDLGNYERIRRRLNVTQQAIAQACWATALHKHTQGTVTLGVIVSGRSIDFEGADRVIGPMFNTIPYRHQSKPNQTWSSLIKKTHEFNISVLPYQHTPLRDIMKWCKRSPDNPFFDTLFVYQVVEGDQEWLKNDAWELEDSGAEADFPMAIEIEQKDSDTLIATLVVQGDEPNQVISNRLLDDFEKLLKDVLMDPDAEIGILKSDEPERDVSLEALNESLNPASTDGASDFKWAKPAIILREEIARLASVEEEDITEMTSIFEVGLDSIDAIKLSSKLKQRGIDITVSKIMQSLTIFRMSQNILRKKTGHTPQPSDMVFRSHISRLESYLRRLSLPIDDVEQVLPLTPLQEGMVAEMIASDYKRYYNHDVLKLAPNTDLGKLKNAWSKAVQGSPILRTAFIEVDDPNIDFSFAQVIHRTHDDFWQDMALEDNIQFPELFEAVRQKVAKAPRPGPLFHIHATLSGSHRYLILSISHALYDGWSLGLLHSDVQQAYIGQFNSRPRYDSALQRILTATGSDAAVFWRDHLADAPPSSFPLRRGITSRDPQTVYRKEQTSAVKLGTATTFAKKNSISLQSLGQTVFSIVLASYVQGLDVTFGSVLSGREDNMSDILFPTMNTVPIRIILHGTRREMLHYVQDNFSGIKQWQHFPLRRAQGMTGAQGPLFDSLFIYQKRLTDGNENAPKLYESVEDQSDVEYPVCVEMEAVGDELRWRCAVKEEVLDQAGMEGLLKRLDIVLGVVIEKPDAPAIDFTSAGTSICGLPAFQTKDQGDTGTTDEVSKEEDGPQNLADSRTVKTIRQVMSFVSKTPEDEITEGMTIFHIGLDSISAIKVSSLLRQRAIVISVGEMLKAGTIERMAQIVDNRATSSEEEYHDDGALIEQVLEKLDASATLRQAGIDMQDVEHILPVSAGQVYMLSTWVRSQGTAFYPEFSYEIKGNISFPALQNAWNALVSANGILRASFVATTNDRIPYIRVVLWNPKATVHDISRVGEESLSKEIQAQASKQPYVHVFVSKSTKGWNVKLKIHHALYDGVSLPLLMQQFQEHCNGVSATVAPPTDIFSRLLASGSTSSALEKRKSFWSKYLAGISPQQCLPSQPTAPPSSKTEIFRPHLLATDTLLSSCKKHGVSAQSVFLACYAKLYASTLLSTPSSSSSDVDVVIGIYLANRSHPRIPNLTHSAIPTVNLVPLRVSYPLDEERGIWEIAAQIQYDVQQISETENAGVGLWEVKEWTGIVVDTFVNFLTLPDKDDGGRRGGEGDGVEIEMVGEWDERVGRVVDLMGTSEGVGVWKELMHGRVNEAYLHAVDIEATIRDGALSVGVFGAEELLGLEQGEKLVESLKAVLEGLA